MVNNKYNNIYIQMILMAYRPHCVRISVCNAFAYAFALKR